MKRAVTMLTLYSAVMTAAFAVAADGVDGGVDGAHAFARLKELAGTWDVETPEGDGVISYRVGSAGSVVIEELFPGTPHEMMTVYHMDGDELVATHYCAAGNQPRFRLDRESATADRLHFAFAGGSNMAPGDGHIHEGTIHLLDPDHVGAEWVFFKDGRARQTTTFTMTRRSRE